jgi:DNA-binding GntR family transcriptional regulator
MEKPHDHYDSAALVATLAAIRNDVAAIRQLLERQAARRRARKRTPEDEAEYQERTRRFQERLAEREAIDRALEQRKEDGAEM